MKFFEELKQKLNVKKLKAAAMHLRSEKSQFNKLSYDDICKAYGISDIGDFSDGYHTFNDLYHQRAVLFAALVKAHWGKSWKSWRHEDGELYFGGGWFVVGIETPEGSYTYHYKKEYWDMFQCVAFDRARHWDGHTDKDVTRLLSL